MLKKSKKWTKDLNKNFPKENIQMAKNTGKDEPQIIREMQVKTTMPGRMCCMFSCSVMSDSLLLQVL